MNNRLNLLVHLNAYRDSTPSNNPALSQFKWTRDLNGLCASKPSSQEFTLAPGESKTMFANARALNTNNTSEFQIIQKAGNTYQLKHISGTSPSFRILRAIGADDTTETTLTKDISGLVTLTATAGTDFDFSDVVLGDEISLVSGFLPQNIGRFKVIAKTATDIVFSNPSATNETVLLGVNLSESIRVYSAAGVQKTDKIVLGSDFPLLIQGTYEITGVQDNLVEFFSSALIAPIVSIQTEDFVIYSAAKALIYLETDKKLAITVNGTQESNIETFVDGQNIYPGVLLKRSLIWSMEIQNLTSDIATLYFVSVE